MSDLTVKINFTVVPTKEPKEILIADTSQWGIAEALPSYLSILPPGSTVYINLNFVKTSLTILNSLNLGLSCLTTDCTEQVYEDLDDGVWEFCLKSSYEGLDKKRYYLKDDSLRVEIDKLRIKVGLEYNPLSDIVKSLSKVEFMLSVAHSFIRDGRNLEAMKAYKEALKITNTYKKL